MGKNRNKKHCTIAKLAERATQKASSEAIKTQGYTTILQGDKVVRINKKGKVIKVLGNIE